MQLKARSMLSDQIMKDRLNSSQNKKQTSKPLILYQNGWENVQFEFAEIKQVLLKKFRAQTAQTEVYTLQNKLP